MLPPLHQGTKTGIFTSFSQIPFYTDPVINTIVVHVGILYIFRIFDMTRELQFPGSEAELRNNIRDNILFLMKSRGLTKEEFSRRCGIDSADLDAWLREGGIAYPEIVDMVGISDGMWVRLQWLIEHHEERIPGDEDLDRESFYIRRIIKT